MAAKPPETKRAAQWRLDMSFGGATRCYQHQATLKAITTMTNIRLSSGLNKSYIEQLEAQARADLAAGNTDLTELMQAIQAGEREEKQLPGNSLPYKHFKSSIAEYTLSVELEDMAQAYEYLCRKISATPTFETLQFFIQHGISAVTKIRWQKSGKEVRYTGDRYTIAYTYPEGKTLTKQPSAKGTEFYSRTLNNNQGRPFGAHILEAGHIHTIAVTEGENDTLAINKHLNKYGICAVTFGGTTQNVKRSGDLIDYYIGKYKVVILQDNDKPGIKAAKEIHRATNAPIAYLGNITTENDICDYLSAGGDPERIRELIEVTGKDGAKVSDYSKIIKDTIKERKQAGEHQRYIMEATFGAGKSYAVIHDIAPFVAAEFKVKCIIVEPLNIKAAKDGNQYNLPVYTGPTLRENAAEVIRGIHSSDVIITNIDNAPKLRDELIRAGHLVAVFIDEAHTLINGNYRRSKITELLKAMDGAAFVFLYTATPKPYFFGYHKFTIDGEKKQPPRVTPVKMTANTQATVLSHARQFQTKNNILIFRINDIKAIKDTAKLLQRNGYKSSEIVKLYSDDEITKTPEYKRLTSTDPESFAPGVKVVLTTAVINEGIDIFSSRPIDFVTIEDKIPFDLDDFLQLLGRHRNATEQRVYLYYNAARHRKKKQPTDTREALFYNDIDIYTSIRDSLTRAAKMLNTEFSGKRHKLSLDNKYVFESNGNLYLDLWKIAGEIEAEYIKAQDIIKTLKQADKDKLITLKEVDDIAEELAPTVTEKDQAAEAITERKEAEKEAAKQLIELFDKCPADFVEASRHCTDIRHSSKTTGNPVNGEAIYKDNENLFRDHSDQVERIVKAYSRITSRGLTAKSWKEYLYNDKTGNIKHHHAINYDLSATYIFERLNQAKQIESGTAGNIPFDQYREAERLEYLRKRLAQHIENEKQGDELTAIVKNAFSDKVTRTDAWFIIKLLFNVQVTKGKDNRAYTLTSERTESEYLDSKGLRYSAIVSSNSPKRKDSLLLPVFT